MLEVVKISNFDTGEQYSNLNQTVISRTDVWAVTKILQCHKCSAWSRKEGERQYLRETGVSA